MLPKPFYLFIILISLSFSLTAQYYGYDESYHDFFISSHLKQAKVKTCTINIYDIEEGEKSKAELYEQYDFDKEGRTTHLLMAWGDTAKGEMDDIYFEYDANGKLIKETWYEGGINDPIDHYYRLYTYSNGLISTICEYYVDDEWEEGDDWPKEEMDYCFEYWYDGLGRILFIRDTTDKEYYLYRYEGGFGYKYDCSNKAELNSVQSKEDLEDVKYLSAGQSDYQKYKGNLLVAEVFDVESTAELIYFSDGRINKYVEKEEGKIYVSTSIKYKKKLPLQAVTVDKDEKGYKEIGSFSYTYY